MPVIVFVVTKLLCRCKFGDMQTITTSGSDYTKIIEFLGRKSENSKDVRAIAEDIIKNVKLYGDEALVEYTNQFDHTNFSLGELAVTEAEIEESVAAISPELQTALELSASRIESYYQKLKPENLQYTDELGVTLGARWLPIENIGIYVPGGKASYPSSVLMNAIPARVAGVKRIVMVSPAGGRQMNPVVLAAAKICGITEIFKIGGAQAIAALAYGTQTIQKVDKIVGPGNAYVAEAKRQVFGEVGIDMIAGPSEILVIADEHNNPDWIAADLLSQAEHDEDARSILITTSQNFAQRVIASVYETLAKLERKEIARYSIENNGLVIVVENFDEAVTLANLIAPEHLELAIENPAELSERITNAGAIFHGRFTPEAIGDYTAGPSHVLPTSTSARFSSGLSVTDFMKRQSIISCDQNSFNQLQAVTATLARSEGLTAHELSITVRKVDG